MTYSFKIPFCYSSLRFLRCSSGQRLSIAKGCGAGDDASISVGANSNVQDGTIVGTGKTFIGQPRAPTVIGNNVTVGHSAILDGVTLEDECLVGIGAVLPHGVTVSVIPCPARAFGTSY